MSTNDRVRRSVFKVAGGKLVQVQLTPKNGKIQEIQITGDFFLHPEEMIEELEQNLIGKSLEKTTLIETIERVIREKEVTLLGVSTTDFVKCILMAWEKND